MLLALLMLMISPCQADDTDDRLEELTVLAKITPAEEDAFEQLYAGMTMDEILNSIERDMESRPRIVFHPHKKKVIRRRRETNQDSD